MTYKGKAGYELRKVGSGVRRWKRTYAPVEKEEIKVGWPFGKKEPPAPKVVVRSEPRFRSKLALEGGGLHRPPIYRRPAGTDSRFRSYDEAHAFGVSLMGNSLANYHHSLGQQLDLFAPRMAENLANSADALKSRHDLDVDALRDDFTRAGYDADFYRRVLQNDKKDRKYIQDGFERRLRTHGKRELLEAATHWLPLIRAADEYRGTGNSTDRTMSRINLKLSPDAEANTLGGAHAFYCGTPPGYPIKSWVELGGSVLAGTGLGIPSIGASPNPVEAILGHELTHAFSELHPHGKGGGFDQELTQLYGHNRAFGADYESMGFQVPRGFLRSSIADEAMRVENENPFYDRMGYMFFGGLKTSGRAEATFNDLSARAAEAPTVLTEMAHYTPEAITALDRHFGMDLTGAVNGYWGFNMASTPDPAEVNKHLKWLNVLEGTRQASVATPGRLVKAPESNRIDDFYPARYLGHRS